MCIRDSLGTNYLGIRVNLSPKLECASTRVKKPVFILDQNGYTMPGSFWCALAKPFDLDGYTMPGSF